MSEYQSRWKVIIKSPVQALLASVADDERKRLLAALTTLSVAGPELGRPYADTLQGSKFPNMKELRVSAKMKVFRLFYIFDPVRNAVVLCGGDKKGKNEKRFYQEMIKLAEQTYQQHLNDLENNND